MKSSSEKGEQLKRPDIEAPAIKVNENPTPCVHLTYARATSLKKSKGGHQSSYIPISVSHSSSAFQLLVKFLQPGDLLMCLNVLDDWRLRLLCSCEQSKIGV